MKVRSDDMTGIVLNWALCKALRLPIYRNARLNGRLMDGWWVSGWYNDPNLWCRIRDVDCINSPTTIQKITNRVVQYCPSVPMIVSSCRINGSTSWTVSVGDVVGRGSTTMCEAMVRCCIALVLGEYVEVLEGLEELDAQP